MTASHWDLKPGQEKVAMPEVTKTTKPDLSRLSIDRSGGKKASPWGPAPKIVLLLIVAAGAWYWWQNRATDAPEKSPKAQGPRVVTADYESTNAADGVSGNGYVIARRRASLSTVLSGRLVEIHVEEGSRVKKGEIVARIQYDDYENSLNEANAQFNAAKSRMKEIEARASAARRRVAQAKSGIKVNQARVATTLTNLAEAKRSLERNRKSYMSKDISEAEWDELTTKVERIGQQLKIDQAETNQTIATVSTAQADLEAIEPEVKTQEAEIARATAQIRSASILLQKTFIKAPFDGIIVDKGAEEGEVVAATGAGGNSKGSVATLVDLETLEVQVELPEVRLAGISEGQKTEIYLDVARKKAWPGHVRQVWPTADRGKGTVEIRIVFDKRPQILRPEMGTRVVFLEENTSTENAKKKISIPRTCVVRQSGNTFVWIVRNKVLVKTKVVLADGTGSNSIVNEGLESGDQVVDRPRSSFKDGMNFPK
ncbi:MAG: RND family efflux transporter MFP subunit [Planctomycetota bacterium]|jgi:RND family efflux transporter MFP subunit